VKHRMRVAAAVLAALVGAAAAGGAAWAKTAGASTATGWTRVLKLPTAGAFESIAAVSKTNAWAVGEHYGTHTIYEPMVEHFDGVGWKPVAFPHTAMTTDRVQGTSAANVWVFGSGENPNYSDYTVAYRWDGKHWHKIPVPARTSLAGTVVLGPKNVWAFGISATLHGDVYHWNGSTWKGYDIHLMAAESIAASSAGNVWLAGLTGVSKKTATAKAYRWNGTRWLGVSTPHPVAQFGLGLTVFSPSSVWMGWVNSGKSGAIRSQAAYWNGQTWTTVTAPSGLAADSTDIIPDARGGYWFGPYVDWTGKTWISAQETGPIGSADELSGVVRIPGTSGFFAWGTAGSAGVNTTQPAIYRLTVG
jgi:hypothetical protein